MKLLHLADLHIGKRVNEFSMIPDQQYILEQILHLAEEERPDAVLIAGDVYDKTLPSAEAVELLDAFLTRLTVLGQPVFLISGNHDSPERLAFGSRILRKNGLHIAGVFRGKLQKTTLQDAYGAVNIYLLPFVKPAMVRPYLETDIETYDDAVRAVISTGGADPTERNILVAHQFVISGAQKPERSESEAISVGGLDQVDASAFNAFDYVALGHLHGPQRIGRETIRYAGSPLKYSFSETRQRKSAAIVELGAKGDVQVRLFPLVPLRDLREIKGPIGQLLQAGRADDVGAQDYIHATLTDEEDIYDALGQLRQVYPNLMALDFENSRSRLGAASLTAAPDDADAKTPLQLFTDFYEVQNQGGMTTPQRSLMELLLEQAGGDEA